MEKRRFEVEPLVGVGPALLGVHRDQLRAAMKAAPIPYRKDEDARWETDAFFDSAFQVFYAGDEPRVEFIELQLWRPTVPSSPDDERGRHFATVAIGIRGYFDGRSE